MNDTIRAFIAIPLDPEIRKTIGNIQESFKRLDCNIKWVKPENIHLTLKFFGDIKTGETAAIKLMLEKLSKFLKSFQIELTGLGAFPDVKFPRVLWLGLKDDNGQIAALASLLEEECGKLGFPKEAKGFSPHVTIGRVRSPQNLSILSEAISNHILPGHLNQSQATIVLYKSTLTPQGPIYEILEEFKLDK